MADISRRIHETDRDEDHEPETCPQCGEPFCDCEEPADSEPELAPNGKPKPALKLLGTDGNAFAILGAACRVMRRAGWSEAEIDEYTKAAMGGDYYHLWGVTEQYCEVS